MNNEQFARNLLAALRRKTQAAEAAAAAVLIATPSEWTATADTVRTVLKVLRLATRDLERELEHVKAELAGETQS